MKVVVFGGSGFLGSHVADAASDRGYDVTVFDLERSPYLRAGQTAITGDILDDQAVARAVEGATCVYHYAGLADLDDATTKPLETVRLNIMGTTTILDACLQAGVKKLIYASTIYVYSDLGGFYRCSKQASELYIEEYHRRYGLEYTILRYGTLYGPRADERNSIYRYLREGLSANTITFSGSAEDVREYVHVRDAARLSVDVQTDEYSGKHVIITGHQQVRAMDLLNMIKEMLDGRVTIQWGTGTPNEAHYRLTPYSFMPKVGHKLVSSYYTDLGQGLLECLHEIYSSTGATVPTLVEPAGPPPPIVLAK